MQIVDNRPPKQKINLGDIIVWNNDDLPSLVIYDENDELAYQLLDIETSHINGAYKEIEDIFDDNKDKIKEIIQSESAKLVIE